MRWLAGAPTIVLVLTACMPAVAPIADGAPEGPQLAIEVVNGSDQELGIGYERQAWDHPRLGGVWVRSLEDLILAKLESSQGVSELQIRDCANLLRTNAATVDWIYLERYARVLGVEELLARLRAAPA